MKKILKYLSVGVVCVAAVLIILEFLLECLYGIPNSERAKRAIPINENEPHIIKSFHVVMPDFHWRVQDIVNANIAAGLSISELAELPAVDASFWFTYDELIKKSQNELANINDWRKNPMSALPAWLVLASKKAGME